MVSAITGVVPTLVGPGFVRGQARAGDPDVRRNRTLKHRNRGSGPRGKGKDSREDTGTESGRQGVREPRAAEGRPVVGTLADGPVTLAVDG